MKIANIICSFNSPHLTERIYKCLKGQMGKLYVLENSTDETKLFRCPEMRDLGRNNVGFGGMHDYIWSLPEFRNYDFVGIFNSDTYDFPVHGVKELSQYMWSNVGMLSPALSDCGTGWRWMKRAAWSGVRDVPHVEDAGCYFNTKLFPKLVQYAPYPFSGVLDITLSMLYRKAGYRTIVSDDFALGHMLAGAREAAGVKDKYLAEFPGELESWFNQHRELRDNYKEYMEKLCPK